MFQDFCEDAFVKYRTFRSRLKVSLSSNPAYDLAVLYYDIAHLWFSSGRRGSKYLALNISHSYLEKSLSVFDEKAPKIDVIDKARNLLTFVRRTLNLEEKKSKGLLKNINSMKEKSNSQEEVESYTESRFNLTESYLVMGRFEEAEKILKAIFQSFPDSEKVLDPLILGWRKRAEELTTCLENARNIEYQLRLEENVMFIEDNEFHFSGSFTKDSRHLQQAVRTWKEECKDMGKSQLLILGNEFSFYLFIRLAQSSDRENSKIISDMVFLNSKNAGTKRLWNLLNKVLSKEIDISAKELISTLFDPVYNLFHGSNLERSQKFVKVYKHLCEVYFNLNHVPLSQEYFKLSKNKRERVSGSKIIHQAKKELIAQQILSTKGLALPGEISLNKVIEVDDFFSRVVPRLTSIEGLIKSLQPLPVIVWHHLNYSPPKNSWFEVQDMLRIYETEKTKVQGLYGSFGNVLILFYFSQTDAKGNDLSEWGVMFQMDEHKRVYGTFSQLNLNFDSKFQEFDDLFKSLQKNVDFTIDKNSIVPKTKKFRMAERNLEMMVYQILKENYFDPSLGENILSGRFSTTEKVFDLTCIEGILALKASIRAAREGYFIELRRTNHSTEQSDQNQCLPTLTYFEKDDQYVLSCKTNEGFKEERISKDKQGINDYLDRFVFKNIPLEQVKKIFVSSAENAFIYHIINEHFIENLNTTTKSTQQDTFNALLKVDSELSHYIALSIVRAADDFNQNYTIYVADSSNYSRFNVVILQFLAVKGETYSYRFCEESLVFGPEQNRGKMESFIHAYFNIKAMQWAWQKGEKFWLFFLRYFKYQALSSPENIELVKKWFVESSDKMINGDKRVGSQAFKMMDFSEDYSNLLFKFGVKNPPGLDLSDQLGTSFEKTTRILNEIILLSHTALNRWLETLYHTILFNSLNNSHLKENHQNLICKKENLEKLGFKGVDSFFAILREFADEEKELLDELLTMWQGSDRLIPDEKITELQECFNKLKFSVNHCLFLLKYVKNFTESFVQMLSKEYGKRALADICHLTENNVVGQLKGKETYPAGLYAQNEAKQVISLTLYFVGRMFLKLAISSKKSRIEDFVQKEYVLISRNSDMRYVLSWYKDGEIIREHSIQIKQLSCLLDQVFIQEVDNFGELFDDEILDSLSQYLREECDLSFNKLVPGDLSLSFSRLGNDLIRATALMATKAFPNFVADYRKFYAETFENFYKFLHENFLKKIELLVTKEMENSAWKEYKEFLEMNDSQVAKLNYLIKIVSLQEKSNIEIVEELLYPTEFKKIMNPALGELYKLLNEESKYDLDTDFYLDKYYSMIHHMVETFTATAELLCKLKPCYQEALREYFDPMESEIIEDSLKIDILDKVGAAVEMNDILYNFEVLNFDASILQDLKDLDEKFQVNNDLKGQYEVTSFLKKCLLGLTSQYIESLLSFRESAVETFDKAELMIYDLLSSFSLLDRKGKHFSQNRSRFEKYEEDLRYISSNYDMESLKAQLNQDKYREILLHLTQLCKSIDLEPSPLKKLQATFNHPSGHTHRIYITKRMNNLSKLISNFTRPHTIEVQDNQTSEKTVIAKVQPTTLSALIDEIKKCLDRRDGDFHPGDEIRIIASDRVYLDVDLNSKSFSGVNIVLLGPNFDLPPMKEDFLIKTNGLDGKPFESQARRGADGTAAGAKGGIGSDGSTGRPGEHAGNISIVAQKLPKIQASACGGNGGPGQLGGNGGDGADGRDGEDGTKTKAKINLRNTIDDYVRWDTNYFSGASWSRGGEGEIGGIGGDTGFSGYGGKAGQSGTINLVPLLGVQCNAVKQSLPGLKGQNADPAQAKAGNGGKRGKNGKTLVMTADVIRLSQIDGGGNGNEENMQFYFCENPNPICKFNSSAKKEVLSENGFAYRSAASSYATTGWNYPFFDRYETARQLNSNTLNNERADTGVKTMKLKDTNAQEAKTIQKINLNQIYENDCKQFLESLSDSTKDESFQPWQSRKINNFMNLLCDYLGEDDRYGDSLQRESKKISNMKGNLINLMNATMQRLKNEEIQLRKQHQQLSIGLKMFSAEIAKEMKEMRQNVASSAKVANVKLQDRQTLVLKKAEKSHQTSHLNNLQLLPTQNDESLPSKLNESIVIMISALESEAPLEEIVEKILRDRGFKDGKILQINSSMFKRYNCPNQDMLVQKQYLVECLKLLTPILSDPFYFSDVMAKQILDWLDAFFDLEQVFKEICVFKGKGVSLQKTILKLLFEDTIRHCLPELKPVNETIQASLDIHIDLLSILYNRIVFESLGAENQQKGFYPPRNEEVKIVLEQLNDRELKGYKIKNLKKNLSQINISLWPTFIAETKLSIRFSGILERNKLALNSLIAKDCLQFLNSLRQTLNEYQFDHLLAVFGEKVCESLQPLFELFKSFCNQKINSHEMREIIKKEYLSWIAEIKRIEVSKKQYQKPQEFDISQVGKRFQEENKENQITLDLGGLEKHLISIFTSFLAKKKILDANFSEQQKNLQKLIQESKNTSNQVVCEKTIVTIACAWYLENKQMPKYTQILALLVFLKGNFEEKNILAQIKTGEGKTLTVSFVSAYLALKGYTIDVVTSNRDLAIDGQAKCTSFYKALGLSNGHNCHFEEKDREKEYKCQIIYGEISIYQGDQLESEFNRKNIVGKRYADMKKVCLIVDEVDSMCLDKAKDVLYLSHNIDGLKWLETVFVYIWIAVLKENPTDKGEFAKSKTKVADGILNDIRNKDIIVPSHLDDYVKTKLKLWVESAFQAKEMDANNDFVIDDGNEAQAMNYEKRIIVLDKDIGSEQYSSRWSNGLAQFLELKFRRKLSVETLKAVFMSNKHFFKQYEQRLYGLTGTLGDINSRRFLKHIYNTNFVIIPTSCKKQFYMEAPKISCNPGEWLLLIAESIREHNHRPILIITDTVYSAEVIMNYLKAEGVSQNKIRAYTRDCDEVEKYFQGNPATNGDIIVATNKGGRGTDIKISDTNNREYGGLHVILTYLPNNERIEDQAFGRTSRNGNPGSGQFILLFDEKENDLQKELATEDTEQRRKLLDELAPAMLLRKKDVRAKADEAFLDELLKTGILRLDIEQELFMEFKVILDRITQNKNLQNAMSQHKHRLKEKLPKIISSGHENINKFGLLGEAIFRIGLQRCQKKEEIEKNLIKDRFEKDLTEFVQNVIKDHWAFWLDSVQPEISKARNLTIQSALTVQLKESFKSLIDASDKIRRISDLLSLTRYPEQQVQLGEIFLIQGDTENAEKCFGKAKKQDPLGVAYIGLAYCKIPPDGGKRKDDKTLKKEVRKCLKHASFKIQTMQRVLSINKFIGDKLAEMTKNIISIQQYVSTTDNFFCEQLESKMKVLETHLVTIKKAIGSSLANEYVFAEGNEKEYEKSKDIYFRFVRNEVIYHNKVRKEFIINNGLRMEAKSILHSNFDKSLSDGIIEVLSKYTRSNHIPSSKFEEIIPDIDGFWEILERSSASRSSEKVKTLDLERACQNLPEEFQDCFDELTGKIKINLEVMDTLPCNPNKKTEFILIKLAKKNSIHLYSPNCEETKLVEGWKGEECQELPGQKIIIQNKNTLYYKLSDILRYSFFSNRENKVVGGSFDLHKSKEIQDFLKFQGEDQEAKVELLFCYILGQTEEPLYKILFYQNLSIECSSTSSSVGLRSLYHKIEEVGGKMIPSLDPYNLSDSLFDTKKKKSLREMWEKSDLITNQKRIKIIDSEQFILNLRRAIRGTKYEKITFKGSEGGVCSFLEKLLEQKANDADSQFDGYLYFSEIPLKERKTEAETIIKILHDLKLLKSGGLALYLKSGEINESKYAYKGFKEYLEKKITDPLLKPYINNIIELQGEIRSYQDGLKGWLKQFNEICSKDLGTKDPIEVPSELSFYSSLGFHRVLVLEEYKRFHMNWEALLVFVLGLLQVVAGAVLCAIGLPNFGNALISEGVSDMVQGMMGMITGNFSLVDWCTSKLISFCISMLTAGIQTLKSAADVAKNVHGTLTAGQLFVKAIGRACVDFAFELGSELISHYALGEVMSMTHNSIMEEITQKIKELLKLETLKAKFIDIRKRKGNDAYKRALHNFTQDISNILQDKSLSTTISDLHRGVNTVLGIAKALKGTTPQGGNWKQKLVKQGVDQGKKLAINTAVNTLKTVEIPKVIAQVNLLITEKLSSVEENSGEDLSQSLTEQQQNEIEKELTQLSATIAGRITGDIVNLISGMATGALKMGTSLASSAINEKIEEKLDKKFSRKNEQRQQQVTKPCPSKQEMELETTPKQAQNIEEGVVSPHKSRQENEENLRITDEPNDGKRQLNLADVKMLANKDGRKILVEDAETGERIQVKPSNLKGKIISHFKSKAVVKFKDEHFTNGKGLENFQGNSSDNNCLLIAYHESLNHKVGESFLQERRASLTQYTSKHPDKYEKRRNSMILKGQGHIHGGAKRATPNETRKQQAPQQGIQKDQKSKRKRSDLDSFDASGRYGKVSREFSSKGEREADHPIPKSVMKHSSNEEFAGLPMSQQPAMAMPFDVHRNLPTTGSSTRAREFRQEMVDLVSNGQNYKALDKVLGEYQKAGLMESQPKAVVGVLNEYASLKFISQAEKNLLREKYVPGVTRG